MKVTQATLMFLLSLPAGAQGVPATKLINQHTQSWYAVNSTVRLSSHWGIICDFHTRHDGLAEREFFYLLRVGGAYWIQGKYPIVAGVAYQWLAPPPGSTAWATENRIYQQWTSLTEEGRLAIMQRIRVEQRWRDQVVNDQIVGAKQFSMRLRYLASFQINVFKNTHLPALVVSDEVLVQFGEAVVFNSFDQNRLFLGVHLNLGKNLDVDTGYMNVFQQRATGSVYDMSHTFRLFLYLHFDRSGMGKDRRLHENTE